MAEDNKRAYNALLTLLNDDSKSVKKPKRAKTDSSGPAPSNEAHFEAVEGIDLDETNNDDDVSNDDEEETIVAEDDNEGDRKDPFETHFAAPIDFQAPSQPWSTSTVKSFPNLGTRSILQSPPKNSQIADYENLKPLNRKEVNNILKHRLQAPFYRYNGELTSLQKEYASPLMNYMDLLISGRSWDNYEEYLNLTILHLINHVYKTRDRVLKNNTKIKEAQEKHEEIDTEKLRDQGFTRPKVLAILPTRDAAYKFVNRIMKISGLKQSENKKRFKDAFYAENDFGDSKPEDFQQTFAGNTNEVFCLGVKFTRQALKLYSSFYACDLIIASPLGLRLIVDQKKDFDFLSSVEICICDQLDAIAMQSWSNIKIIFNKMNLTPKDSHDCDFSRVREWCLDEKSKFLRQTILLGSYITPEMLSLFNKSCLNVAGKFRSRTVDPGIIASNNIHIRQMFIRTGLHGFSQDSDQRMAYFSNSLLPSIMRGAQTDGIFIVAPTYTDFVVLRNYLEKNDYSYVSVSEYTPPSQLGRGRTFFADGRAKIMLYSARLHHYRRYGIKGIKTVVFYGLPDNPIFYQEFLRSLARTVIEKQIDPDLLKMYTLYSKWDALKLERVVGTKKMPALMEGIGDTYEFS